MQWHQVNTVHGRLDFLAILLKMVLLMRKIFRAEALCMHTVDIRVRRKIPICRDLTENV